MNDFCVQIQRYFLNRALVNFYLPREFPSVMIFAVYIPPEANAKSAIDQLSDIITQHENANSGALSIIVGDFNHTNLRIA